MDETKPRSIPERLADISRLNKNFQHIKRHQSLLSQYTNEALVREQENKLDPPLLLRQCGSDKTGPRVEYIEAMHNLSRAREVLFKRMTNFSTEDLVALKPYLSSEEGIIPVTIDGKPLYQKKKLMGIMV
jgi:hypothetical protein